MNMFLGKLLSSLIGGIGDIGFIAESMKKVYSFLSGPENPVIKGHEKFIKRVQSLNNNVCIINKKLTENESFPLEERLADISTITFMNYAATAFISSEFIAKAYEDSEPCAKWFFEKLTTGALTANVILTDPNSHSAKDAAQNKMNPSQLKVPHEEIIQYNINKLLDFKAKNPNAKINLYLTDICLPYGIMYGECASRKKNSNYMKVDLYSPVDVDSSLILNDDERPSFYLLENNKETKSLYDHFKSVINHVMKDTQHTHLYTDRSLDWITNAKGIIHRGHINKDLPEHSVRGYLQCIKNKLPFEVDLLFIKDSILVCRNATLKSKKDPSLELPLSSLDVQEIRNLHSEDWEIAEEGGPLPFQFEEIMTLPELLDLVNGRVGILLEAKFPFNENEDTIKRRVKELVSVLRYYSGNIAVHSANPFFLKHLRQENQMMCIGQISWSFIGTDVSDNYRDLHQSLDFKNVVTPDFISYKISELTGETKIEQYCTKNSIPLLTWTVHESKEEKFALDHSYIPLIDGSSSYLSADKLI